jgi:hypothetical protein
MLFWVLIRIGGEHAKLNNWVHRGSKSAFVIADPSRNHLMLLKQYDGIFGGAGGSVMIFSDHFEPSITGVLAVSGCWSRDRF